VSPVLDLVYTTGLVRVNTDIPLQDRYPMGSGYTSSESVSRSPGRRPLSDSGLSVSECSGGGSDGPGVGSCVCGVCVERP